MSYREPRRSAERWMSRDNPPPAAAGDLVVPTGNYTYGGWKNKEPRLVQRVVWQKFEDFLGEYHAWRYVIHTPDGDAIHYNPKNFLVHTSETEDRKTPMAYERTKFFAMRLNGVSGDWPTPGIADNGGFWLQDVNDDHETDANHYDTTTLRDTRTQTVADVRKIVRHGDKWIVCQTVCLIEGEEPRPPVKITEYR